MQPTERRIFFILTLIAGLAWIVFSRDNTGASAAKVISAPEKGFLAPDFTLKTSDQQTITLSELKGQAVLVNYWATWCPPCRTEMPAIEKLYLEYKDQGFIVLGLNSTIQDNQADITTFIKAYTLTFPTSLSTAMAQSSKSLLAVQCRKPCYATALRKFYNNHAHHLSRSLRTSAPSYLACDCRMVWPVTC